MWKRRILNFNKQFLNSVAKNVQKPRTFFQLSISSFIPLEVPMISRYPVSLKPIVVKIETDNSRRLTDSFSML